MLFLIDKKCPIKFSYMPNYIFHNIVFMKYDVFEIINVLSYGEFWYEQCLIKYVV